MSNLSGSGLIQVANWAKGAFVGADGLLKSDFVVPIQGDAATAAAGGVFAVQNTTGQDLTVTGLTVRLMTGSGAVWTLDAGVAATAILADNLIDGASIADTPAALGTYANNIDHKGVNGAMNRLWPAGYWVTGSQASGNAVGAVVFAHICCTCEEVIRP